MATFGVSFESSGSIEERKEKKRQTRQEAIDKAKQQYEREETRKELKRQRGEDTWLLPEVNQRLQQIEEEGSIKSKKKKEKKSKKKKEKKKKSRKEKKTTETEDGSSGSSEDSGEEWVEAQSQVQAVKAWQVTDESKTSESSPAQNAQRDEWMTFDFLAMKTTSTAERRAEKERQKEEERAKTQAIEQAGLHKLELNPYWKDGGTGLPPEEVADTAGKKGPVVNDGGLSWLRKNYQRMKEQAEREQRSLSDVVAERYGSMEEFQKRLADAENAVYGQNKDDRVSSARDRWRKGEDKARERWRRKEEDGPDQDWWRKSERNSPLRDKERYHGEGREERDRHRGRGEEGGRDGDRYRERDRSWDRDKRGKERERDGGRDRSRENDRDRHKDRERDRYRAEDKEKDGSTVASSSGQSWNQCSLSLGSLKGRFLKPSEDEDSGIAPQRRPAARPSTGFVRPSSDDEDPRPNNITVSVWKKSSTSSPKPDSFEKFQEEKEMEAKKTVVAPQDSVPTRTESESEEEEEIPLLSEEEMNKLGSKLIKAEMMGNQAMVEKLKSQLEAAHKAKENHAIRKKQHEMAKSNQVTAQSSKDQELLLFRTDQSGRAWPVKGPSGPQEPHGGRRKKKPIETHVDGQRVRYFQNDDNVGLQEMVRREKMSSAQDQNALYSRMAAKMMGKTDGDNYTLDDMFVSSAAQREGEGREEERMRNRAIGESRKLAASMNKCQYCFSSQELQKHLIVAIGSKVYLSLPAGVSMTDGHCLITPLQHHCSATGLDEDVWSEMQLFRRTLVRMFESQELDCVFMETCMNPRRRQHMVLECIPLPKELGDMAPIYFKKAIMECDEEWAMNKKIVDLSSKDVRRAVPQGLPYFAVDFGLQGGFAHVIENEQKFPYYFGKEVVGGMMDLEPRRWRKSIRENFDDQRKKVLQFAQWWKPYDCTKTES
ncbi:CWF19-like protein 2 isoform X2 [Melanotaenia boesemani]|uniref:CWF19-like protein 2 isoform X2 n=1 Tax=Melanotaenia boesemani TaxID=1250792 RepID=UPI001C044EAA|nr:CWF19-like protein 2 isoform X2 [Melanotaenia boesemani]